MRLVRKSDELQKDPNESEKTMAANCGTLTDMHHHQCTGRVILVDDWRKNKFRSIWEQPDRSMRLHIRISPRKE